MADRLALNPNAPIQPNALRKLWDRYSIPILPAAGVEVRQHRLLTGITLVLALLSITCAVILLLTPLAHLVPPSIIALSLSSLVVNPTLYMFSRTGHYHLASIGTVVTFNLLPWMVLITAQTPNQIPRSIV